MKWTALALAAWLALPAAAQQHLEVRVLDVGQADAILLSHEGLRMLYDAGIPLGGDPGLVADRLESLGVDTIHLAVVSHPHFDHLGGMAEVLRRFVVLRLMEPGVEHGTAAYRELRHVADSLRLPEPTIEMPGRAWYSLPEGDVTWRAARGWLLPAAPAGSVNDRSIGVRVCLELACIMLAGDAEEAAWERWIERYPELLAPVTVHKASHHGSRNGDTPDALARLSPELVVVSAGEDNRYGHPHEETLALYEDVGARVLRTDLHGEIVVELYADGSYRAWVERAPEVAYLDRWRPRWPWGIR
jgi:competence protein ComEC